MGWFRGWTSGVLANAIRKNELGDQAQKNARFFVDQNLKSKDLSSGTANRHAEAGTRSVPMDPACTLRPTATPENPVSLIGRPKPRRPEGVVRPQRPQPGPSRQGALAASTTYL